MNDSLHLYITGTRAFLRRETGLPWRRTVTPVSEWEWDAARPATLQLAVGKSGRYRRPKLFVYVGSALCKLMVIDVPAELRDPNERKAVALALMQHQMGLDAAQWEIALDVMAPPAKSILCALRRDLVEHLHAMAKQHGLRLHSVRPYIAQVWNTFLRGEGPDSEALFSLIAVENDAATILTQTAGRLEAVQNFSQRCAADVVDREVRRLYFMSADGGQHDVHVAMCQSALASTGNFAHRARLVDPARFVTAAMYPDFRELLFGLHGEEQSP